MAQFNNMFNVDLSESTHTVMLRQMVCEGNNQANKIGVTVTDNGQAVTLGGSCSGKVIRSDGVTVLIDGVIDGSTAYIILDGNSCAVPGMIVVSIDWVNGDNVTTLLNACGVVTETQTGNVIPSGNVLNIDTIIQMVEAFATGQYVKSDDTIISGDGSASVIADHSNVEPNTLYRLQLTTKMSWLPADYPATGEIYYMIDYVIPFSGDNSTTEVIFDENMCVAWVRQKQPFGTFGAWCPVVGGRMQIKVSPGTNTIQDAVARAYWVGHADVILLPGTHEITNFSGNGMSIGNDMRIIGEPGSIITAHSPADNQYFSPFYCGAGDFELIGVNIDASRIRYCVHDDPPSADATTPARHVYRECNMYIDNTENTIWGNHQCIGGGMGMNTGIVIENCVFDGANPVADLGLVSYHNNAEAGAKGYIFISNCQFKKSGGTARFGWYGSSTEITPCYVVNCLVGTDPVIRAETQASTNENMSLITWGNTKGTGEVVTLSQMNDKNFLKMQKITCSSLSDMKDKLNALMDTLSSETSIELVLITSAFDIFPSGTHSFTMHKLASTYFWGWGFVHGKLAIISRENASWATHQFTPDA